MNTELCNGTFANGKECPKKKKCVKYIKKLQSKLTESAMNPDVMTSSDGTANCGFFREMLND